MVSDSGAAASAEITRQDAGPRETTGTESDSRFSFQRATFPQRTATGSRNCPRAQSPSSRKQGQRIDCQRVVDTHFQLETEDYGSSAKPRHSAQSRPLYGRSI